MTRPSRFFLSSILVDVVFAAIAVGRASWPGPAAVASEAIPPGEGSDPLCAVGVDYPLRVTWADDPVGLAIDPNVAVSIEFEIVAARQFEALEVELISSPGVDISSGPGTFGPEQLGILRRGETRVGTVTASLGRDVSRGTVEVRIKGEAEGALLHAASVWNLVSKRVVELRAPVRQTRADGRRVQQTRARRVSR
jgi:hypothetical protein